MDFGKYKYTQARRQKEARKKQTTILVKEVKMGPKTERHDFDFKVNAALAQFRALSGRASGRDS